MSNIKLSIIVPIYNVAPYLRKCVDSLLAQDYSDYEIILVDDGSTDESPQICDEYAIKSQESRAKSQEFTFVRVIHQENGGLSVARNSGIEVAQGKYIMFVDSDDYIEPNVLGTLVGTMEEKQLDVLRYNYQNVRENGEVFIPFKTGKPYFDYREDVLDGETFLNERLGYACYAWAFVLHCELLNGCVFTHGIYFEDTDWTPRMLIKAKRVSSTERVVYNYLWREGSITLPDNSIKKKKVLEDKLKLISGFIERQKQVKDKRWFIWQIAGTTMSILGILSTYPAKVRNYYLQRLKAQNIFPLSTYRSSGMVRRKIQLANFSPRLYCIILNLLHK